MQKDFKLTVGTVRVVSYQSNVDIFYWKNGNNNEADSRFVLYFDSCIDYTTEENIEDFIANFEYAAELTPEDRAKLKEELWNYINPMSSDR